MLVKKKNLKYLSRSVLLEEESLPRTNQMVIVVIFLMLVAFIAWTFYVEIDEKLEVSGLINFDQEDSSGMEFILKIPQRDLERISVGHPVTIQITAQGEENQVRGEISRINNSLSIDDTGFTYHEAVVELDMDDTLINYYKESADDLLISGSMITGKRTLFVYILRPFYRAIDNSLQEP